MRKPADLESIGARSSRGDRGARGDAQRSLGGRVRPRRWSPAGVPRQGRRLRHGEVRDRRPARSRRRSPARAPRPSTPIPVRGRRTAVSVGDRREGRPLLAVSKSGRSDEDLEALPLPQGAGVKMISITAPQAPLSPPRATLVSRRGRSGRRVPWTSSRRRARRPPSSWGTRWPWPSSGSRNFGREDFAKLHPSGVPRRPGSSS